MFTGIIQGIGQITEAEGNEELRTFTIQFPRGFCADLERGASVAVNGVCLTATEEQSPDRWKFDVMLKSLDVTNLCDVAVGRRVNAERAARDGSEIGGHPLSGHIDFTAAVEEVRASETNKVIRFSFPTGYAPFLFSQGYIAIDGASLTIAEIDKRGSWFEVWLIPETRRATILDDLTAGDRVNIEIDRATQVVVETIKHTVEEVLTKKFSHLEAALLKLGVSPDDLFDDGSVQKLIQDIGSAPAPAE